MRADADAGRGIRAAAAGLVLSLAWGGDARAAMLKVDAAGTTDQNGWVYASQTVDNNDFEANTSLGLGLSRVINYSTAASAGYANAYDWAKIKTESDAGVTLPLGTYEMLSDFIRSWASPSSVTVTNLKAGTYNVVVYVYPGTDAGSPHPITVNGTSFGSVTSYVYYAGRTTAQILADMRRSNTVEVLSSGTYANRLVVQTGSGGNNSLSGFTLETTGGGPPAGQAPTIANGAPTGVTASSATLNGSLTSTGTAATAVWAFWDTSDKTTNKTWGASTNWPAPQATGTFSHAAVGLDQDRTYYYTYYASNSVGDKWANAATPSKFFITGALTVEATDPQGRTNSADTMAFTVTRPSGCTNEDLTLNYVLGGTAALTADYVVSPASGAVVIAKGSVSGQVTVTPVYKEDSEKTVSLTVVPGLYVVGSPSAATGTLAAVVRGVSPGPKVGNISASASHWYGSGECVPVKAVDGTGLSGGAHASNYDQQWMAESGAIDGNYIVLDLHANVAIEATGALKFWNNKYAATIGMRRAKFYTSDDYITWTERTATIKDKNGAVTSLLPQSTGTGFDGTVDLGAGVTARYIKIVADGASGTGNWGHGSWVGLAEVEAYGWSAATPSVSNRITTVSALASSTGTAGGSAAAAVNGSGLTGMSHNDGYGEAWLASAVQAQLDIDLGAARTIQGIRIWNLAHRTGHAKAAMRKIDVLVANSANFSDAVTAFDNLEIPCGGNEDNAVSKYDSPFLLDTRTAISGQYRYVRITNSGNSPANYGSTSYSGISEVQFFEAYYPAVPPPPKGTVILLL